MKPLSQLDWIDVFALYYTLGWFYYFVFEFMPTLFFISRQWSRQERGWLDIAYRIRGENIVSVRTYRLTSHFKRKRFWIIPKIQMSSLNGY